MGAILSNTDRNYQSEASTFRSLARARRSIRRYQPRSVPRELVESLLEVATAAPSNFNRQPWYFLVAETEARRKFFISAIEDRLRSVEASSRASEVFHYLDHTRRWLFSLAEAPVLIFTFYKPSPERLESAVCEILDVGGAHVWNPNLLALGMAIQNLLLAAQDAGLGACMHSGPVPFLRGVINQTCLLPTNLQLAGIVSLGYSMETPSRPPHKSLERVSAFLDEPGPQATSS